MPFSVGLTLAVTDNHDGTAAVSVTGATTGRKISVYTSPVTLSANPQSWTLSATGNASGGALNANATVSLGAFNWLAVQYDAGAVNVESMSPIIFAPLIAPANSVKAIWEQCLDALKTGIQGLSLSGLPSVNVSKVWWPELSANLSNAMPGVQIAPVGSEEYVNQVTTQDDLDYPCVVVIVDKANKQSQANLSRVLLWRQSISRAFRYRPNALIQGCYTCDIAPDLVLNPDAYRDNLIISVILFKFRVREPRGYGS